MTFPLMPFCTPSITERFLSGFLNSNNTGGYGIVCDGSLKAYAQNEVRWGCLNNKRAVIIENGTTNYVLHNTDFSQSEWLSGNFSDTGTTTSAPDGTITPIYSLGDGYVLQNLTGPTSGETYTTSVWVKANKSGVVGLRNLGKDSSYNVNINLTTDWVRHEVTLSNFDGDTPKVAIDNRAANGYGVSGLEISIWGWQVEEGAIATSTIVTGASTTTRAADIVTAPLTDDYTNGVRVRGTFRVDAIAGNFDRLFVLDDGTTNNRILFYRHKTAGNFQLSVVAGGANQGVMFYSGADIGDTIDIDLTITQDAISGKINGGVVSEVLGGAYTAPTIARLGRSTSGANIPARMLCSKFLVTGV